MNSEPGRWRVGSHASRIPQATADVAEGATVEALRAKESANRERLNQTARNIGRGLSRIARRFLRRLVRGGLPCRRPVDARARRAGRSNSGRVPAAAVF